ncbi:phage terminase large subunit [Bosea sp. F3-2]|uniref:phage terminase large subunit n=1 Tax=Bosea sp. F3-2 TaxID=2599640 RepID=UPI0020BFC9D1|nr:phage terminase large subunit [Bosea sp. F3-2]
MLACSGRLLAKGTIAMSSESSTPRVRTRQRRGSVADDPILEQAAACFAPQIVMKALAQLTPSPRNARKQIHMIAESIKAWQSISVAAANWLHPGRDTRAWLGAAKLNLGALNFSAQYQQNPLPAEGQIIKRDWLQHYDELPEAFELTIASWDTASTQAEHSDWSGGTVWGAVGQSYYLIDVVRDRWEAPQLRRKMVELSQRHHVDARLIEDTELGRALSQDLRKSGVLYPLLQPSRIKKTARPMAQATRFEVFLPREAHWLGDYLGELLAFPLARHDDQVDATSQALKFLTARTPVIRERPERIVRPKGRARP